MKQKDMTPFIFLLLSAAMLLVAAVMTWDGARIERNTRETAAVEEKYLEKEIELLKTKVVRLKIDVFKLNHPKYKFWGGEVI